MHIEKTDNSMDWIEKHGKVVPRSSRHTGVKYKSPHRDVQDYYFDGMTVRQRVQDEAHAEEERLELWKYDKSERVFELSDDNDEPDWKDYVGVSDDMESDFNYYPEYDEVEEQALVYLKRINRATERLAIKSRYFGRNRRSWAQY